MTVPMLANPTVVASATAVLGRHAARASATRPESSTVIPTATSQPKNAAPTFEPPNRCRTSAGTAATGPVAGSATAMSRTSVDRSCCFSTVAMAPCSPLPTPGNGAWDDGGTTYEEEQLELVRRPDVHHAVADPQLLHHRPHRPRQVDAGRPHAAAHGRRRRAANARAVPRPHGHRARARHHDQGTERAAAVEGRRHRARAAHDRHPGSRRLHLRGLARARGV